MASEHKPDGLCKPARAASIQQACASVSADLSSKFCSAMRNFAGACCVIATADGAEYSGLTATAVCSVTADPPRLLVVVNHNVFAHDIIKKSSVLSINVLTEAQRDLALRFSGQDGSNPNERFEGGEWDLEPGEAPRLRSCLASFRGNVSHTITESTHTLFLIDVTDIRKDETSRAPLIYFDRKFATLTTAKQ
ncbi:flavin reductase-like, FMN-binding protein [Hyphomonas adhaerens MHS-3]|uniref:Flavin reductase-like, FMN-binding protein n=1 Tax=Hyphomonas adhaerens MHS-3 TaxID=1280949 RepID=A0A069E6U6_9PROT|nr:flavin reductase family protein [Hyphomonas adhaerens]KCZ86020.1 flavin reductase-like, FMN-binding protein [Hyphomonas adhaerens MHS-3]